LLVYDEFNNVNTRNLLSKEKLFQA